jgi:hypothetical protein
VFAHDAIGHTKGEMDLTSNKEPGSARDDTSEYWIQDGHPLENPAVRPIPDDPLCEPHPDEPGINRGSIAGEVEESS